MPSSTSSSEAATTTAAFPRVAQRRSEGAALRRFLLRLALFALLLFVLDRSVAALLLQGLERYYGLDVPAEVLLIGHSHTMLGVDHQLLGRELGASVAKYARQGATLAERRIMIRQFLDRWPGATRVIVYDVEAALLNPAGLSRNSYRLFLPFIDEPVVTRYVRDQNPSLLDRMVRRYLHAARFDEATVALAVRGLLGDWRSFKSGVIDAARLRRLTAPGVYRPIVFDPRQLEILEATIREVRARGVTMVLAFYPTIDQYNSIEPEKFSEARALFARLGSGDPGVVYLEYLDGYADRHDLFYDPIHLNRDGQLLLTRRLAQDLGREVRTSALAAGR